MSPKTRIRSTLGMAASTASSASRLLWMSDSRPTVGPAARLGVDALVSVEKEDAQGRRHRHRDEEAKDAAEIPAYDEGHDDQHRAEMNGVTEHLGRDEVVDDVGDHEVDDQHHHDLARRLRHKGGDREGG